MIYASGLASLLVQFSVGLIDLLVVKLKVNPKDELLKDLLRVEIAVQVIEFLFYVWLLYGFKQVATNITPYRYLDWAITTPLMLITLSGYLNHDENKPTRLGDFVSANAGTLLKIVLLNAAMLLFGLIGELGYMNVYLTTILGFIPLFLNFKYIKDAFLQHTEDTIKNAIFNWFVFFWSLYGLFALMNHTNKNTGYNILDIFSKNFFGLFLAYAIWSKSQKEEDK